MRKVWICSGKALCLGFCAFCRNLSRHFPTELIPLNISSLNPRNKIGQDKFLPNLVLQTIRSFYPPEQHRKMFGLSPEVGHTPRLERVLCLTLLVHFRCHTRKSLLECKVNFPYGYLQQMGSYNAKHLKRLSD